jgi:3',5'-cyclic AMP phosphodiesterase CpdA
MQKIIQISDLHFGTEHPGMVEVLINDINNEKPDILIVSGDSTQRAKISEFKSMLALLQKLNTHNIICVPGNHDISLYNPVERFLYPFLKYDKWLGSQTKSSWVDDYFSILGINTVTPYKPMGGYVDDKQFKSIINFFEKQPKEKIRIVVMHHNLIRSERHKIIHNADEIVNLFSRLNVNIVLAGHIHSPHCELLKHKAEHNLYVITAGTAISHRTSYPNSFNVIEFDQYEFKFKIKEFRQNIFMHAYEKIFNF